MTSKVKHRESNIELLRIVMMLLIVAHHYVVNSGLLEVMSMSPITWKQYFLYLFGMWGKIGINGFVLITGYYMCKSDITIRKFLKLVLEVLFYNVVCYAIFTITRYESVSILGLYKALLPIGGIAKGFTSCFIIYYLLIPFLNILVTNITKHQHRILIALCILFFVCVDHLPSLEYIYNYVSWFCIIHIIASYLRFYEEEIKTHITKSPILLIVIAISLAIGSVLFQVAGMKYGFSQGWAYKWVSDSNAILAVIAGIMLFWGFLQLEVGYSKWINSVAASTFGVLCIHANSDTMRKWLWQDMCHNVDWMNSPYMPLHATGCVLVIFIVCIIIDKVRIYVFEKPAFNVIDKILMKHDIK